MFWDTRSRQVGDIPKGLDTALRDPAIYPHPVTKIEVEETHISKVFLTGLFVYKVKKSVDFGFLDFSTLAKRKRWCEQEVQLNRRLSRGVYLEVVAITRGPEGFALGGKGEAVEYAVKMRELPRAKSMLAVLRRGEITPAMIDDLARFLAAFYSVAAGGPEIGPMGSVEVIRANTEENFSRTEPFMADLLGREEFLCARQAVREFLERHSDLFQRRVETGRIRDGHGDLRLDHIYFEDRIQIIDCVEFNERLRQEDVTADLAFLAMELDSLGCSYFGWRLIKTYAQAAGDPEIYILLDFYKCYRAYVRCKVDCLRLAEGGLGDDEARDLRRRARRHSRLAAAYAATFSRQTLWVVCGLSASGKSTIAREMATRLRVGVRSSDVVRKLLVGVPPYEAAHAEFGAGIYTAAQTARTYETLLGEVEGDLRCGRSIIADGTFGKRRFRDQARRLARGLGANIVFVECICPEPLLRRRLSNRQGNLVTDARAEHFDAQRRAFEAMEELPDSMHIRVRTDASVDECLLVVFSETYLRQLRQTRQERRASRSSCTWGAEAPRVELPRPDSERRRLT
ncbi:MAG TPA: AAA family ATPase [Syntrophobacteria bacterium]|nr:AAA family ATPase [Syntrophobacteria bacterium]